MYEIKIYTEDIGDVPKIASRYFDAFTVNYGQGYWEGTKENSITLTFITKDLVPAHNLASTIRDTNAQDAVLVTWHEVEQELI